MHRLPPLALPILLLACSGDKDSAEPWLVSAQDLGADVASGTGLALSPDDAWMLTEQVTPGLAWDAPALDIVDVVFSTMLEDQGISDDGSCPYTVAEGPTLSWISNCRSADGYDWDGTVRRTTGTSSDDGTDWTLWDLDLEVTSDDSFADLARVTLRGQIYDATGDGSTALLRALQTNVEVGVVEYREALNGTEDELAVWADWKLTLRAEQQQASGGTRTLIAGKTDLGARGGASFSGLDLLLSTGCPNEVDGDIQLDSGSARGTLAFAGSDGCDRCGRLTIEGQDAQDACP